MCEIKDYNEEIINVGWKFIQNYFELEENYKISSDRNIVTRFAYKKIGDNREKSQSDVIINIFSKAHEAFSSYFGSKSTNSCAQKPKYKFDGELFIVPFFTNVVKIKLVFNTTTLVDNALV